MRLVVVGGEGYVGAAIVEEALDRAHEVTTVVPVGETVPPRPGLRLVPGRAQDARALTVAFEGEEVVVGALVADSSRPKLYDEHLEGARAIVQAVRHAGVARLLWVGGAGSLLVSPGVHLVDSPDFPVRFKPAGLAAREILRLLSQERDLDWTILTPPIHVEDGPRTGIYRTGADAPVYGANGDSHISFRDLAVAVVDELERPRHARHRFTVGY
jgi:uncharacterized protein